MVAVIAVTLVMGATPQRADSKSGPSKVDPSLLAVPEAVRLEPGLEVTP